MNKIRVYYRKPQWAESEENKRDTGHARAEKGNEE